jgi:hypothetical protein
MFSWCRLLEDCVLLQGVTLPASSGQGQFLDEGPIRRTREGGGCEWEPIKILFKNSAYEPDFTRAPPQASLAKSTQPLKCYWT